MIIKPLVDSTPESSRHLNNGVSSEQCERFEDSLQLTNRDQYDHLNGISELLFEVAYGASEALHSKAPEVLGQLLSHPTYSPQIIMLMRYIFLKLFNEVDIEKQ